MSAGAIGLALATLTAPTAAAAPSCTTTTPALDEQITCTYNAGGSTAIQVPAGATHVLVTADGAGGGGGSRNASVVPGGAGGTGARVVATLDVTNISDLTVVVGAGGAGGTANPVPEGDGGAGGGFSAVYSGQSTAAADVLVIAGGGGGGGNFSSGTGGSGAAANSDAGGNGVSPTGYTVGGGSGGIGAPAAANFTNPGQDWSAGGAGGVSGNGGADGGSGYGGGAAGLSGDGGGGAGGSFADPNFITNAVAYSPGGGAGGAGGNNQGGTAGTAGQIILMFSATAPTPAPSTDLGEESSEITFTLRDADDEACASSSVEGTFGAWVTLPTNLECSGISTRSESVLLGWATAADFPVEIAQRQFDNGWGAYEIFNDDGSLASVFIPAGRSAFAVNSNSLFAIWGT